MVSTIRAIPMAIREIIYRYQLDDINAVTILVLGICYNIIGPFLIGLFCIIATYQVFKKIERLIFPPPPHIRYEEAINDYRSGKVREALKEFERLYRKDGYSKAVLSLAAHEIYVANAPMEGLRILRESSLPNKQGTVIVKVPTKAMKSMQDDAKAILEGDTIMVDMNARLAKQQYLGVTTI